jgi:hypothetical protein
MKQLLKIQRSFVLFYWLAVAIQVFFIGWYLSMSNSYIMPFFHFGFLVYFNERRKKSKKRNLAFLKEVERLEEQQNKIDKLFKKHTDDN